MLSIRACNVTVMVTDLDNAIEFYTKSIGLTLKGRYGNHWADISGPGITIGLHPSNKNIKRGDNLQIGIGVPDIKSAIKALEAKGGNLEFNKDDQVRIAFFKDPDENVLYLIQSEE